MKIHIDKYDGHTLRLSVDDIWASRRAVAWIRELPEVKEVDSLAGACWLVPITSAVWDSIHACELPHEISEDAYAALAVVQVASVAAELNAHTVATFKHSGKLPDNSLPELKKPLVPYQKVPIICAMRTDGYGFFMEQGTGKTAAAIGLCCALQRERQLDPNETRKNINVLVLAPKNVRTNWAVEFENFAGTDVEIIFDEFSHASVIRGGVAKRVEQILKCLVSKAAIRVVIMSYDSIATTPVLYGIKWDVALADESQYFKDPKSKRWQNMRKLRDHCDMRIPLTGTPIGNSPMDLWTQFEWMAEGRSGFTTFKAFKNFFGTWDQSSGKSSNPYERLLGLQNVPIMKDLLARHSYMITLKEALPSLPDTVYDVREVELSPEQEQVYVNLERDLIHIAEEALAGLDGSNQNPAVVVQNILVQMLRLSQVCSGYVTYNEIRDEVTGELLRPKTIEPFKRNPKLEALLELLEEEKDPYSKKIIWSNWVFDIEAIKNALGDSCVVFYGDVSDEEREHAKWRFNNDPTCKYFVGNPAAGGTGLNLLGYEPHKDPDSPYNADHMIYYACNWSSLERRQSSARCVRRGTRRPVRITDLLVPGTVDEDIRCRVIGKINMAMQVQDLREVLSGMLSRRGVLAYA